MLTTITINDIEIETNIGICDWEYERNQTLFLSLELDYDASLAAQSDDINDALDYADVTNTSKAFIAHHPARLIEPRLKGLVDLLLKEYALIKTIKATLSKPEAIDYARNVSQTITVTRATD